MPAVGARCHELRVVDDDTTWRILYHVADDAVVKRVVDSARARLKKFQRDSEE
jgi:hypothetical protein